MSFINFYRSITYYYIIYEILDLCNRWQIPFSGKLEFNVTP